MRIRLTCLNHHRFLALQTSSKVACRVAIPRPVQTKSALVRADASQARLKQQKDTPKGSRTPVFGLRTRCPRPLDDGGVAEQCDSSGQHWPFQVFDPKTLETSLSILPRTSRRPPPWRRQTSPSNCKTNCKTKCCKRACYGPHST